MALVDKVGAVLVTAEAQPEPSILTSMYLDLTSGHIRSSSGCRRSAATLQLMAHLVSVPSNLADVVYLFMEHCLVLPEQGRVSCRMLMPCSH